jgi:hypothetical protein
MGEPLPLGAHKFLDKFWNNRFPAAVYRIVAPEAVFIMLKEDQVFATDSLDEVALIDDNGAPCW